MPPGICLYSGSYGSEKDLTNILLKILKIKLFLIERYFLVQTEDFFSIHYTRKLTG